MSLPNIAETVYESEDNITRLTGSNVGETMLDPTAEERYSNDRTLKPGQTIAKDYVVVEQLGKGGTEATVYTARREGKQCVVKLYNKGHRPAQDFIRNLRGHSCPYVANLIDYGYESDTYYEIYEYYKNGTLEDKGKRTTAFIKDIFIPSINEGLHFLHTLSGTGIVHGDIKPSNIFISNDETHIVIGDFGISSYLNKAGKSIDEIKGTPEYAPRTVSFFGKATKTPAYDYGSLGLVLIKLATGHSLFEGLDMTAITNEWESGIQIPTNIESRLRRLIEGLLIEDEKLRFGYEEVKRWCEGEFLTIKENNLYTEDDFNDGEDPDPLIFGIFNERMVAVDSLKGLSDAIAEHWDHTKKQLKRTTFFEFIAQFSPEIEKDIREYGKLKDEDKAVFFTLYRLRENKNLIYKGINYGSAKDFVQRLNDNITADMQEIINNGLFEHFLKVIGCDPAKLEQTRRIMVLKNCDPDFVPRLLYYAFNPERTYILNGKAISTIDEFIAEVVTMDLHELEKLTEDSRLMAWLYNIGYQDDILKLFEM